MDTYIVTGCAGFIGSNVVIKLLKSGHRVVGIDNLNDYYDPKWKNENIYEGMKISPKNFIFIQCDIRDANTINDVFKKYKAKYLIHLAARAGVRPSIKEPNLYSSTNVDGTINVLEASVKSGITHVVFASSSSVYGNGATAPFVENANTDFPLSQYAATKKAGEVICYTYSTLYNLNIACLRFFTVYGPKGRPDMAPYLFTEAVFKGDIIKQYGDGSTARDYTYIDDIVDGIIAAISKIKGYNIYNLGNSKPITLSQFINIIELCTGLEAKTQQESIPPGDVNLTYADITKAKEQIGYDPRISIEKGMKKFTDWYQKHRSGPSLN